MKMQMEGLNELQEHKSGVIYEEAEMEEKEEQAMKEAEEARMEEEKELLKEAKEKSE